MSIKLKKDIMTGISSFPIVKLSEEDYNYLTIVGAPPDNVYTQLNDIIPIINTKKEEFGVFKINLQIDGISQWWMKVTPEYRFFLRKMVSDYIEEKNLTSIKMPKLYAVICESANLIDPRDGNPMKDAVGKFRFSSEIARFVSNIPYEEITSNSNSFNPKVSFRAEDWEFDDSDPEWASGADYKYRSEDEFVKAFDKLNVGDMDEKLGIKSVDEHGEYVTIAPFADDTYEDIHVLEDENGTRRPFRSSGKENKYSSQILLEHQPAESETYGPNVALEMMYLLKTFHLDLGKGKRDINITANKEGQCVIIDCEIKKEHGLGCILKFVSRFGPSSGAYSHYTEEEVGVVNAYLHFMILLKESKMDKISDSWDAEKKQINVEIPSPIDGALTCTYNLDDLLKLSKFLTSGNLLDRSEVSAMQDAIQELSTLNGS
tara:strand:- start:199 stop:1491 length:1293 start_codon:yes stop_codon:yes gene_type:complete